MTSLEVRLCVAGSRRSQTYLPPKVLTLIAHGSRRWRTDETAPAPHHEADYLHSVTFRRRNTIMVEKLAQDLVSCA